MWRFWVAREDSFERWGEALQLLFFFLASFLTVMGGIFRFSSSHFSIHFACGQNFNEEILRELMSEIMSFLT